MSVPCCIGKAERNECTCQNNPKVVGYIDDDNRIIILGFNKYLKTGFVDLERAIPDSWKKIVVIP